ncbi:MAG: hypothetical protein J5886_04410 [Bacteroidales bacterium]|nr:hypothetical protein [Bacteroidales bacterium]
MVSWLISIKRKFPWLWRAVESVNGAFFHLRHRDIRQIAETVLLETSPSGYKFSLAVEDDACSLSLFLAGQPEESFRYFRPHRFDEKTLRRIIKGYSYLVMKVTDAVSGEINGYFFLRCFCDNRAFAGLLVDNEIRNKGVGTSIWTACSNICQRLGIRMFATIDEKNLPSLRSCDKGTDIVTKERLSGDYILVECKTKDNKKDNINKIISPVL